MDPKRSVLEGIRGFARERQAGGLKNKYAAKEPVPGAEPEDQPASPEVTPEWGMDLTQPTASMEVGEPTDLERTPEPGEPVEFGEPRRVGTPVGGNDVTDRWGIDVTPPPTPQPTLAVGDPTVTSRVPDPGDLSGMSREDLIAMLTKLQAGGDPGL